jgi:hypothetical protein
MQTIEVRLALTDEELLDTGDDIAMLLEEGEISPALRELLLVLDDAITAAFVPEPAPV